MDRQLSLLPHRYRRYTRFLCILILIECAIILAGWASLLPGLLPVQAVADQMKVDTVLGFMLGSISLWSQIPQHRRPWHPRVSQLAAMLLLALAGTTILEYALGLNLGIDQVLQQHLPRAGRFPGKPSLPAAIGLAVTGIILIAGQHTRHLRWTMALAMLSIATWTGLAVLHAYGVAPIYRIDAYGGTSISSVFSFILLNLGFLFANAQQGFMFYFTNPSYAGVAARRLLPAAYVAPILFGWLVLASGQWGMNLRAALAIEAQFIALLLTVLIGWSARSLVQLERIASMRQAERLEALEKAARLAHYDALTGLPNRVLLQERTTESIKLATRRSGMVALLFIDLDRFKPINDTHGHQAGDRVLVEIGARLKKAVRESDTVARLGGDEFVVLLSDIKLPDDAASIADKLIKTIEQPYRIAGSDMFLSASIGIGLFPKDGADTTVLMECADAAMYYAKSLGKRNFQFYAPQMTHEAMRRASIERQLRMALDEGGISVAYQPKVALGSGRLIGFEALVRLKPADGRPPVAPEEFIPIAEESGLIVPLGAWVLNEACRQNRAWQDAGYLPLPVSVNVSAVQFRGSDFVDTVASALQNTGLNPAYLDLEITESTIMQDFDRGIDVMRRLQDLGVSVSIDDFGIGSSSLGRLKLFSADTLKIDRTFIRDLPHDKDDAAITSIIIDLARNLNQKVVAEGVETKEQLAFLKEHGCDSAQGFYFSAPLSATQFEALYGRQW